MHVVSWETNKTRFLKYTSPQIGKNQNCPTWVWSPLYILCSVVLSIFSYLILPKKITQFIFELGTL